VSRCDEIRELLSARLEGELDAATAAAVAEHLADCRNCAELAETMADIAATTLVVRETQAPPELEDRITASPCQLWLRLLFRAVDRELPESSLARLLEHLEACDDCRRTWNDITLIHQVGEALTPPEELTRRCIARTTRPAARMVSARAATAAAYVLAVLTSLLVGNPVSLARHQATQTVQQVGDVASSAVSIVTDDGRGELRVMLWRTWQWGARQVEAAKKLLEDSAPAGDDTTDANQGGIS